MEQISTIIALASSRVERREIPKAPPVPPTTSPTVTSNIAADAATSPKSSSPSRVLSRNPPPDPTEPQQVEPSQFISSSLAQKLRDTAFRTTEAYVAFSVCTSLFAIASTQAPYKIAQHKGIYNTSDTVPKTAEGEDIGVSDSTYPGTKFWHEYLGLQPTFSTWSQVTFLHMYIAVVRMRVLDRQSFDTYMRHLINAFSFGTEEKMHVVHNIESRTIRNKYLKDLFIQWRGIIAAYDEGLVKGDAMLGTAVWRNLWKADPEVDWQKVTKVVEYLRRVLVEYEKVDDEEILFALLGTEDAEFWESKGIRTGGLFERFQEKIMKQGSMRNSKGMTEPFRPEGEKAST
ncbi:MAG: hypothetical protein Q9227_006288 [Pyrenula ochraceoflavens]